MDPFEQARLAAPVCCIGTRIGCLTRGYCNWGHPDWDLAYLQQENGDGRGT